MIPGDSRNAAACPWTSIVTSPAVVVMARLLVFACSLMAGRMIALKREYRAIPCAVRGHESQLQQAFMNLLLNAVEAMAGGGELAVVTEIGVAPSGVRRLKIHIRDTGSGIAEENLARVFDTFFTTKKNGTGLGLAICRRVAHEHHGELEVHSEPGKGAVFIVSLPVD